MKRNERRTMQPTKDEQKAKNTPRRQQQRNAQYEADAARAAARRASVINIRPQQRDAPQQRQARFTFSTTQPYQSGSRESIAPTPAVNLNPVQQWFYVFVKQGGCKRVRQRFVNDLCNYKTDGTTRAFDDENNTEFNRYSDVPLLDSSRIKLRQGPRGNDYIHASLVNGADFPIICAQGPVEESAERFWIMIVEQKCGVIVQLCQNFEDGKERCYDYIPTKMKQRNFGGVQVRIKEEPTKIVANPSLRKTVVEASYKGSKVEVTHYLYDGWPDHEVPLMPKHFRHLRTVVHDLAVKKKCSVVVHCSAGIGRTGTYAAIEVAIRQMIKNNKCIQMADIFRHIRGQRALAIQTDLQYLFLHRAIVDAALIAGRLGGQEDRDVVNKFLEEYDTLIIRKRKERRELMEKRKK